MLGAILGTGGYGTEQNRQISSYTELAFSNCNELVHIREVSPGGTAVKDLPVNPGDTSLSPGSGRSPGGGNGNPLQYSCPKSPRDTGARQSAVRSVAKSWTRLNTHTLIIRGMLEFLVFSSMYLKFSCNFTPLRLSA